MLQDKKSYTLDNFLFLHMYFLYVLQDKEWFIGLSVLNRAFNSM